MRLLLAFVLCYGICVPGYLQAQSVGIGTATPHDKAALHIESATQGTLITRLTTAQRDVIANPPEGLMVYNLTTHCLDIFNGATWISYCGGFAPPPFTFSLGLLPTCLGIHPDGKDSSMVTVTLLSGVSQPVSLSIISGVPAGVSVTFSHPIVSPTGTSRLRVVGSAATPGTYTLTVQATDGTSTLTQDVTLVVSAAFTIAFPEGLGGLEGWWQADSTATLSLSGGFVGAWNDISGNNKHMVQGAGGLQPQYVANVAALGNLPALYFDGSNDILVAPNVLNNSTVASTFVVMVPQGTSLRFLLEQRPNESQYSLEGCAGMSLGHYINNSGGATAALTANTGYYLSYVAAGTMRAWRNGTAVSGPNAYGGNTGTGNLSLGGRTSGACASYFQGHVAEIIIYNRALADCERQLVERYLQAKYGF